MKGIGQYYRKNMRFFREDFSKKRLTTYGCNTILGKHIAQLIMRSELSSVMGRNSPYYRFVFLGGILKAGFFKEGSVWTVFSTTQSIRNGNKKCYKEVGPCKAV
jgi:hypothetical protein